jgi:hypothetical protein
MITSFLEYISYKMAPGPKKDYKASSITTFILSVAWMASTGTDQRRVLPSFLALAWTSLLGSIRLLYHLWQGKACLNRLMLATQQVGGEDNMRVVQQGRIDLGYSLCQKLLWLIISSNASPRNATTNLPWSPLWQFDLKEQIDQPSQHSNYTNPGYSNRMRIHAAHNSEQGCHDSSTTCRHCTQSPWVTIILGSQAPVDPME